MSDVLTFTMTHDDARFLIEVAHHASQHLKYGYAKGGCPSEQDARDAERCEALALALHDALDQAGATQHAD